MTQPSGTDKAREMLAAAYEDAGMYESLAIWRELGDSPFEEVALRAIEKALTLPLSPLVGEGLAKRLQDVLERCAASPVFGLDMALWSDLAGTVQEAIAALRTAPPPLREEMEAACRTCHGSGLLPGDSGWAGENPTCTSCNGTGVGEGLIRQIDDALTRRFRNDTSEYNRAFDNGVRAAKTEVVQLLREAAAAPSSIGETEELTRLRAWAFGPDGVKWYTARYAEQEARIEELRKALEPFAKLLKHDDSRSSDAAMVVVQVGMCKMHGLSLRDLRRARDTFAALASKPLPPTDDAKSEYWLDEVLRRNGPCPTCGTLGMLGSIEDAARQSPPLNMGEGLLVRLGEHLVSPAEAVDYWVGAYGGAESFAAFLKDVATDVQNLSEARKEIEKAGHVIEALLALATPSLLEGMVLVPRELTPRLASLIMDLTGCSAAYAEHLWSRLLATSPSSDLAKKNTQ